MGIQLGRRVHARHSKAWLSDRREYTFDGKGGYTFARRFNIDHDADTTIVRERGTYSLSGDVLVLKPARNERETWSKVRSGANAGAYDKLLRREKLSLEPATYRVAFTVYSSTQVPNLMLSPSKQTERDGYTPIPPTP